MKIPRMATVVLALAVLAGSSLVSAALLGKRAEPFTPPDAAVQAVRTGGADGEPILVAPSPQAPATAPGSITTNKTVPVVTPPVLAIGAAGTATPSLTADPDLSVSFASPQADLVDVDPSLDLRVAETDLSVSGLSLDVASAEATSSDLLGSQEAEHETSKASKEKVGALGWWSENGYSPDNLTAAGSLMAGTSSDDASAKEGSSGGSDKAKGKSSRGSGKSKGKASGKSKGKGPSSSSSGKAGHSPKNKAPAKGSAKPRDHKAAQPKSSSKPHEKKSRGRSKGKGKR
ncbi:MAG: hypothetical protein ACR2KQ_08245 [Actinomycetota bacterium]